MAMCRQEFLTIKRPIFCIKRLQSCEAVLSLQFVDLCHLIEGGFLHTCAATPKERIPVSSLDLIHPAEEPTHVRRTVKRHIRQKLCGRGRQIKLGDARQLALLRPRAERLVHTVNKETQESQTFVQRIAALLQESKRRLLHDAKSSRVHLRLHRPASIA